MKMKNYMIIKRRQRLENQEIVDFKSIWEEINKNYWKALTNFLQKILN